MIALFGLAFFKIKKITAACSLAVMALLRKHYKKKNDTQTISKEQGTPSPLTSLPAATSFHPPFLDPK
jgi:hypothetical protein